MVALRDWEEEQWEVRRDQEAFQAVWRSVLERTIRDIFTYRDQRTQSRKKTYETALNWVMCWDWEDRDQPHSFPWVCLSLGWDPEKVASLVWEDRNRDYETLSRALKEYKRGLRQR